MSDPIDFLAVRPVEATLKAFLNESPAWTRLEPQTNSGDPTPGIEARFHDPLWALARQWQLAEFEGEDAGTPITVEVKAHTTPVTAWQPGDPLQRRPALPIDPALPLDEMVEKEAVSGDQLGLRDRAEAGAYLLELLEDAGVDARSALMEACPLPVEPATDDADIPEHVRVPAYLEVLAAVVPDGVAAAEALETGDPPWLAGTSEAGRAAADAWLRWFRSCVVPAAGNDSWIEERFEYRFSVRVGDGDDQSVLNAPLHEGGALDWYSFDYAPRRALALDTDREGEGAGETEQFVMIATPLRFAGMPADRYWELEDGEVHLGRLDAQPHDLARLCVAEFAMVYGNDWLAVPLTVRGGSLTRIDEVAYTTTFGERFVVREADDRRRSGRFRMFTISHQGTPDRTFPGLLVPPTALGVLEGRPLEDVAFLRDEMANMAWAVERTVQGRCGEPRSRGDEERPVNRVEDLEAGAELQYLLRTEVPKHWIPFVPVSTGIGEIKLRKGTMAEEDLSLGVLLDPIPMTVEDEEVPREGLRVRRVPALARGADGRYLRWIARRVSIGRGEGWSGLAFDGAYRP
jgi:hypothetical protein